MFPTENLESVGQPKNNKKLPKPKEMSKKKNKGIEQLVTLDRNSYHLMANCINLR